MKKLAVLLVCVLWSMKCLIANPLPLADVTISEIMFDAEKGWMLELYCYRIEKITVLNLTVASASGSAESNYFPNWDECSDEYCNERFVLTRDSMKSDLSINPLGDEVTVIVEFLEDYYGFTWSSESVLTFGNYIGSKVHAPSEGQSIVYYGISGSCECDIYDYAKTNEPTMGEPNTSNVYGTVTGKIYDIDGRLVLSNETMTFVCRYNFPTCQYGAIYNHVPVEDGSYSINVLANCLNKDYIFLSKKKVKIKPIKIDIEPDAIYEVDIYLLEDYVGMDEITQPDNAPIHIYPNPLSGGQELQYEVGAPVKSLDCQMEIIAMDGRVVCEKKITDNVGSITLPHSLPTGIYIVNFKFNNKAQYATRLIIGK